MYLMLSMFWIWFVLLVVVVVMLSIIAMRRKERTGRELYDVRVCGGCGANNPYHARFCAQCGSRLA